MSLFVPKNWVDSPSTSTPISAAALEDLETRVTDYADDIAPNVYFPESYGAMGDGSTDDSTAFKSMMSAIQTGGIGGDVVLTAGRTYLLDSAPVTTSFGNAIVPLPVKGAALGTDSAYPFPPQCLDVRIRSLGHGSCTIKTTRTTDAYSATNGSPSVIGGPTPERVSAAGATGKQSTGGNISVSGVIFQVPTNPKISALDIWYAQGCKIDGMAICTPETASGTQVASPALITVPTNKWTFGVRFPFAYNQGTVLCQDLYVHGGPYAATIWPASHVYIHQATIQFVALAVGFQDLTSDSLGNNHPSLFDFLVITDCKYGFAGWDETSGAKSLSGGDEMHLRGGQITVEAGASPWDWTSFVLDTNNVIRGYASFTDWGFGILGYINASGSVGGTNFDLRPVTVKAKNSSGGALFDHYADVNNSGTGETDLYSDSIPGYTLQNNGEKIRAHYDVALIVGAGTRQVRVYFAGTSIFDSTAQTVATIATILRLEVILIRTSSTTVRYLIQALVDATTGGSTDQFTDYTVTNPSTDRALNVTADTLPQGLAVLGTLIADLKIRMPHIRGASGDLSSLDLTTANILKITGQSTNASNQITAKLGLVKWEAAA